VTLTWKMQMSITLLITMHLLIFLQFIKASEVESSKFESHSVFRIEEYIA